MKIKIIVKCACAFLTPSFNRALAIGYSDHKKITPRTYSEAVNNNIYYDLFGIH
ncbi:MAG: hypothetical protein ACPL7I_06290 [Myxococcota bacterium]